MRLSRPRTHLQALQAAVAAAVVDGDADAPRQLHGDSSLLRDSIGTRVKDLQQGPR